MFEGTLRPLFFTHCFRLIQLGPLINDKIHRSSTHQLSWTAALYNCYSLSTSGQVKSNWTNEAAVTKESAPDRLPNPNVSMMMHHAMNQLCKVCGEPAAGFHFGAFTCEGCKSFFGRTYNNLSSLSECKNNGRCVINKKNRTSCKSCRLRKCLMVGMSKSGSRYGRRSNWFKIHCLLQDQANLTGHQMDQSSTLNGYTGAMQSPGGGGVGSMNLGSKIGYEHDERARGSSGCGDSSSSESGVGIKSMDESGVVSMRGASSSPDSHDDEDSSKVSSNGSSAPPTLLLARAFSGSDVLGTPSLKNGTSGSFSIPFSPGAFESPSPPNTADKKDSAAAAAAAAAAATAAFLFAPSHQLPISPISPLSPLHQPTKFLFNSSYLHHSHQHHAAHLQHHSLHQHHAMMNGLNGYASKLHPAYRPFLQPASFELNSGGSSNKLAKEISVPVTEVVACCTAPEQEIPIDLSVKKAGSHSSGTSVDDDDARSPLSLEDCSGDEADRDGSLQDGDCEELNVPQSPLDLSKNKETNNNEEEMMEVQQQQQDIQSSPQHHENTDCGQNSPSSVHN